MACIEITEADFDDMHHALGRGLPPFDQPSRNFYCVGIDSETARHFEELGMWECVRVINDGKDGVFRVNDDGKSALSDWLSLKAGVD